MEKNVFFEKKYDGNFTKIINIFEESPKEYENMSTCQNHRLILSTKATDIQNPEQENIRLQYNPTKRRRNFLWRENHAKTQHVSHCFRNKIEGKEGILERMWCFIPWFVQKWAREINVACRSLHISRNVLNIQSHWWKSSCFSQARSEKVHSFISIGLDSRIKLRFPCFIESPWPTSEFTSKCVPQIVRRCWGKWCALTHQIWHTLSYVSS